MGKRKILLTILIIFVTAGCIYLGNKARYDSRIRITQLAGEGNGYVLETSENSLIVIDGGNENDSQRLKQIITEKSSSNSVAAWFLTSVDELNSGAILKLIDDEDIKIENIYVSFNSAEWYENSVNDPEKLNYIENLVDKIYNENREKTTQLGRRAQFKIDNYIITALEVADDNLQGIENQTVILNVDNTFKNINFFGNIGKIEEKKFFENDKDMHNTDIIQLSGNGNYDLLNYIKYKEALISNESLQMQIDAEKIYTKQNGEAFVEIW